MVEGTFNEIFLDKSGEKLQVVTEFREDGSKAKQLVFDQDGNLHHDIKPAIIEFYPNGNVQRFEFYQRNKRHRENNPAIEVYSEDGRLHIELQFFRDGLRHRDGFKPAVILTNENGMHTRQEFWHMGTLNRESGPAIIVWDENTKEIKEEYFYKMGKQVAPSNKTFRTELTQK